MEHSSIIDRLEADIRQWRVEYQRFFNGDAAVPPEEQGLKIRARINQLMGVSQLSAVDRFRLSGLEGRYNSLFELFRRRLRDLDQAHHAAAAASAVATQTPKSVIVGDTASADEVGSLYDALYTTSGSNVSREDFHAYLLQQATKVRHRTGCSRVRFTVRSDGGKKQLKARPLPTEDAG